MNCDDFGKVVKLICLLLGQPSEFVTKFVNDIFRYMAQYNTKQYVNYILNFDTSYNEFTKILSFIIHSTGFMDDSYAFPLLAYLRTTNSSLYSLECNALINDRFSIGLRKSSTIFKNVEYFRQYVEYVIIPEKPLNSLFFSSMGNGEGW